MRATVAPAQMLPALVAMVERPCVTRKPRVLQGWLADFPASNRLRESNDFKPDSLRIRERKFISAIVTKTVPFPCHMIEAPATEPIARGITRRRRGAIGKLHMANPRLGLLNVRSN